VERQWQLGGECGGELGLCVAVRESFGYSVACAHSEITGAGDGIFARGTIPRGRVISVYAGSHFSAWEGVFDRLLRILLPWSRTPGYEFCQADGSVIDGASQRASVQREKKGYVSPSACSQLANHPPHGMVPNSCFMTVLVPRTAVFAKLPVSQWWGLFTGHSQVATLLISLAAIEDGEEVFVDYKYGVGEHPKWYTACAGSEAQQSARWRGPSIKEYLELD